MAKVKYYAKENSSIGTHSFYAVPIPNGTLTFDITEGGAGQGGNQGGGTTGGELEG